jgi:hypothetical protein
MLSAYVLRLEDGSSLLLEDGISHLLLEAVHQETVIPVDITTWNSERLWMTTASTVDGVSTWNGEPGGVVTTASTSDGVQTWNGEPGGVMTWTEA